MFKIMTLDGQAAADGHANRRRPAIEPLPLASLDVLCCQSITSSRTDNGDPTRVLAAALGMTSSCFAASPRQPATTGRQVPSIRGLAILTGASVWMLNSGSFALPGDQEAEDGVAQFGLIRKENTSVLILNCQLATSAASQDRQLRALFSHPLLKETYGAVVLATDRQIVLTAKKIRPLTQGSNYRLRRSLTAVSAGPVPGMLCLLAAREASTLVSVRAAGAAPALALPGGDRSGRPRQRLEFEVERIAPDPKHRQAMPLSFREQWLGGREHRAFAA